ncbi:MAG: acyl-CoA thioesterase [Planctomycetes bacterium]|nr:acyl-CoA thioesterase [Planctomycetota bacterium]MCC7169287.1 acyl-CoA thioesterase [Planctomycetota bacterium]
MAYRTELTVRFGDCDKAGIAYYPVIFHYCHVAFEEFFEHCVGIAYPTLVNDRHLGFPMGHVDATFESPFQYGMKVTARVEVLKVGTKSTRWRYAFFDRASGTLLARIVADTVAVDMRSFTSTAIPDDVRSAFLRCGAPETD